MLFVNRMGQSIMDNNTHNSKWNYVTFSNAIASKLPAGSKVLLLGLGGGSVANSFSRQLHFQVDAVELDGRISDVAQNYFDLDPSVNIIIDDARHQLEISKKKYSLIYFDVFKGDVLPSYVLSKECFEKAKSLLDSNGMLIVNFNGFLSGEVGLPSRWLYNTLKSTGLNTEILPTPGIEKDRNNLFVAARVATSFKIVRSPLLFKGSPVNIDSMFISPDFDLKNIGLLTDDIPSLDRINMAAGNTWRKGYNTTYTKFFQQNKIPLFK
jgi:hypothetical protein